MTVIEIVKYLRFQAQEIEDDNVYAQGGDPETNRAAADMLEALAQWVKPRWPTFDNWFFNLYGRAPSVHDINLLEPVWKAARERRSNPTRCPYGEPLPCGTCESGMPHQAGAVAVKQPAQSLTRDEWAKVIAATPERGHSREYIEKHWDCHYPEADAVLAALSVNPEPTKCEHPDSEIDDSVFGDYRCKICDTRWGWDPRKA